MVADLVRTQGEKKVDKRIGLLTSLVALFFMGSAPAEAGTCPTGSLAPVLVNWGTNDATGHRFEVYRAAKISWVDAKACADNLQFEGVEGHLATITSSSEHEYVNDLKNNIVFPSTSPGPLALAGEVWVGGSQVTGAPNAHTGWEWENGEGVISVPGKTPAPDYYSNWAPAPPAPTAEPNDYYGQDSENYLAIGLYDRKSDGSYDPDGTGWNDEGAVGNIKGFIVEYDTPRTVGACDGTTACTTIEGQTLTFPQNTTGNITFSAYEFRDPRVVIDNDDPNKYKCRSPREGLTLFREEDGFPENEELRIPAYLCGSPNFVVVKVNSDDLSQTALDGILKGVVEVENKTDQILPGNVYKCFDPLVTPPLTTPYAPDPQYQDVVVWQSTDPSRMFEDGIEAGPAPDYVDAAYVGAATEATNGCRSTTAKVRGASYFVVGMHINFGDDAYDYPAVANYEQFVKLTSYKLSLLRTSVDLSRQFGSIKKPDWQAMSSQLKNAFNKLNAGDPAGALSSMQQFVFKVNSSIYSPATGGYTGFNFNGDHLMRGENIVFTLRVKVVPFKPVP
jgi:hypothetical protein